jgi:hypothetical protein
MSNATLTPTPALPNPGAESVHFKYHVYVMYSDADAEWCIREFISMLEKAKLTLIHKQAFSLGKPLFRTEDEAIRSSLCTIAFLTPEFVKSKQDTFLADRAWDQGNLVPVMAEECEPDLRLRNLTRLDLTDPTRWRAELQRLLEHLGRSAQEAQAAAAVAVVRGLRALSKLMRIPQVQGEVSKYEAFFSAAASEIEGIAKFKKLHDDFQATEGTFRLVVERRMKEQSSATTAPCPVSIDLEQGLHELLADLRQLQATAAALPAHMISCTPQIATAVNGLTAALTVNDAGMIGEPLELIERLLGIWLSRINQRIVEGVARLSLATVANGLQSVRTTLTEYQFDEQADALFDDFKKCVASLRTLANNLEALHANHNWLQEINDALAPLQRNRRPEPQELRVQWQFVVGPVSQLDAAAGPSWVNQFQTQAAAVTKALAEASDAGKVRILHLTFNTFRTDLDKVFNRADRDLLTLCDELKTVGQALRQNIGRMQHG